MVGQQEKRGFADAPCEEFPPCRPADSAVIDFAFITKLRAFTVFSNTSRSGDYVAAAVSEIPLDGDRGTNVFLLQRKLQFMFELADNLYVFLEGSDSLDLAYSDYRYVREDVDAALPVVHRIHVAWTPSESDFDNAGAGLIVDLAAELFQRSCVCEVRTTAKIQTSVMSTDLITEDWSKGAALAMAYFRSRVLKRGVQEFSVEQHLARMQQT